MNKKFEIKRVEVKGKIMEFPFFKEIESRKDKLINYVTNMKFISTMYYDKNGFMYKEILGNGKVYNYENNNIDMEIDILFMNDNPIEVLGIANYDEYYVNNELIYSSGNEEDDDFYYKVFISTTDDNKFVENIKIYLNDKLIKENKYNYEYIDNFNDCHFI